MAQAHLSSDDSRTRASGTLEKRDYVDFERELMGLSAFCKRMLDMNDMVKDVYNYRAISQ